MSFADGDTRRMAEGGMVESMSGYARAIQERQVHARRIGLSWTDDGVTLICERKECMERFVRSGHERLVCWQRELPYMCTPEVAVELRDKHLRGEW